MKYLTIYVNPLLSIHSSQAQSNTAISQAGQLKASDIQVWETKWHYK